MMKKIIVVLLLLVCNSAFSQNGDYIVIKHIGEEDKPIFPLSIIKQNSDTTYLEIRMRFAPPIK